MTVLQVAGRDESAAACEAPESNLADLNGAGVEFIDENGGSAGVRLKRPS